MSLGGARAACTLEWSILKDLVALVDYDTMNLGHNNVSDMVNGMLRGNDARECG
jgi:hypothetical protein